MIRFGSVAERRARRARHRFQGDRNPALADAPELDYDDAVELVLLLEALSA